jgi:hypothetical protein
MDAFLPVPGFAVYTAAGLPSADCRIRQDSNLQPSDLKQSRACFLSCLCAVLKLIPDNHELAQQRKLAGELETQFPQDKACELLGRDGQHL